ncbi:hypothetical protein [Segetibacter sp.]|uniref:hypothetical protein n=1 Tax=Segetibacter sp. TaxID=2231182 RepID=UPI0026078529|nr:hypothetical protein [Segetibacter sp.]
MKKETADSFVEFTCCLFFFHCHTKGRIKAIRIETGKRKKTIIGGNYKMFTICRN